MPSTLLPPLTSLIDQGAAGGQEFERLMHQLLIEDGKRQGYSYDSLGGAGGDGGIDGWVAQGLPGFQGPVAFQFKWLWEDLYKSSNKVQIQDSLQRAARHLRVAAHWVLVTPWDLKPSEREWLTALGASLGLHVYHWGQARIENLLRGCPALFARYYAHEAQALPGGQGCVEFRGFAARYREQISLAHRHLRTLGLPPEARSGQEVHKHIPLREVFIPLQFVSEKRGGEEIRSLAQVLTAGASTVLVGDPGTGKTTLLSFVSLLLSGQAELPGYSPPSGVVPLFISLRQFMRMGRQQPGFSFIDYLVAQARSDYALAQAHPFFFEAALRMGESFVLFDGLDEVGNAPARQRIKSMIEAFRAQYPACPIWVSSRIYGYTLDVRLSATEFQHLRLGRLDDTQVAEFIRRWYTRQLPDNPRDRKESTESLLQAVQRTPSVRRLAGNPLLLTLMAFIHQGLRKLPQDRGELYEKCVEMLLRTWQEARRGEEVASHAFVRLELHIQMQKDYLAHLALHVQQKNQEGQDEDSRGLISRRDALDSLATRHLVMGRRKRPHLTVGEAREEMADFLDYISDQTGLLIDRGGDQLSFIHLSFQEYLAAWVFTCEPEAHDHLKFFTTYLGRPAWEEVLLLRLYIVLRASGGGGPNAFDTIIKEVRRKLDPGGPLLGWLMLIRALRDNLEFSPEDRDVILRKGIETWSQSPADAETWLTALEEVRLFSGSAKERLRELLDEACEEGQPAHAIACLHLRKRLFGWPEEGCARLARNPKLPEMLPDLVVFLEEPSVKEVLDTRGRIEDWNTALAGLEGRRLHGLTLEWALGFQSPAEPALRAATARLGNKVVADLRSRKDFATKYAESDASVLFQHSGHVLAMWKLYGVDVPLAAIQAGPVAPSSAIRLQSVRSLAQPVLAQARFRSDQWNAPAVGEAFRNWAVKYMGDLLRPFQLASGSLNGLAGLFTHSVGLNFGRTFGYGFSLAFGRAFDGSVGRDFGMAFGRAFDSTVGRVFGRDVVRDLHRDVVRQVVSEVVSDVVRAFIRDVGREFGSSIGHDCIRAFGRDFIRAFGHEFFRALSSDVPLDVIRDTGRGLAQYSFGLVFGRDFGRDLLHEVGIDPEDKGWEKKWEQALLDEAKLATLLRSDNFWFMASFRRPAIEIRLEPAKRASELRNPFALPFLMAVTLGTGLVNYLYSLGRHLAVATPGPQWEQVSDEWIGQNPPDVYAVAFAWEELAQTFSSQRGRLAGAAGALMLVHAAYARLMTGFSCDGPVWTQLVEARDSNDSLIQAAYVLHELAHFRDVDKNVQAWEELSVKLLVNGPAPSVAQPTELREAMAVTLSRPVEAAPVPKPSHEPDLLFAWAHLSDIHWGHGGAGHSADQQLVLSALEKDLSDQLARGRPHPDALLVTGDIAFSGEQGQYAQARDWLLRLARNLRLDSRHIFTVPGNHDVQRAADKDRNIARMVRALREGSDDLDEALANDADRAQLVKRMAHYLAFAERFAPACLKSSDTSSPVVWAHSLDVRGGLRVRLVGLNTALLAADSFDKGNLRLGKRALEHGLGMLPEDNELILVLSHHPLRDGWLADGREADRWLQGRAHVHLFGHVHEPDLEEARGGSGRRLIRIAAGAVHGERQPEGVPAGHGYSLAALYRHQEKELLLRVWPRVWSDKNTDFLPDVHNLPKDRDCAEHVIAGIQLATSA